MKSYYAVAPLELGYCLLSIGRTLCHDFPADVATPAAPAQTGQRLKDGWFLIDLPNMVFPKVCCSCLEPTTDQQLFRVDSSSMQFWFPHCRNCTGASRWKYWRVLGKYALLFTLATTLLAALIGLVLDLNGWGPPGDFVMTVLLTLCHWFWADSSAAFPLTSWPWRLPCPFACVATTRAREPSCYGSATRNMSSCLPEKWLNLSSM